MTECKDIVESVKGVSIRDKILNLEDVLKNLDSRFELEPVHYFAQGIYAREITIPKGSVLTGKIHKTEHLNIVSKGDISVVTEFGSKRIQAPFTFVAQPGTKRVGYAHEETVWTTVHATEERDLVKLEAELIAVDYPQLEKTLCLG